MGILESNHPVIYSILAALLIGGFIITANKKLRSKVLEKIKKLKD
jgi:hypothetical protein